MLLRRFAILFFLIFSTYLVHGQKVALVLSGGGAKGIAHVGVIKALEEHNIPIDYVVGTSMGGIVAGCYAAGYSAAQIEGIMLSPTFLKWVNGEFERGYNYYFYKDDPNSSFASIRLSLDSTLNATLNSSLASDITLNFALPEYLAQASAIANNNFDSLFVPTRIIAADVFTQSEMVLKNASLPFALRTTLSVPFFYRPIKIDNKYLFDGGIYNNFPVDIAQRDFAPDMIIGSNVSTKIFEEYPYDKDDKLVNNSLIFMLLDKSDPSQIPESGIYLEPDLDGYTAFDFDKAKALIDSGYQVTIKQIDSIKARVNRRQTREERRSKREAFLSKAKPYNFSGLNFHGYNSKQRKYIRKLFQADKGPLTMQDIKKGYFKMVSEKYFSSVYPDIQFDNENQDYTFELFGRPRSNLNVEVGGAIATRNVSQIFLGAEYYYFDNYLLKNTISFYAGGFYKSARLTSRLYLAGKLPFYIEPELLYNDWDFLNSDDVFLDDDIPTILDRTDRKYGLNLGIPMGNKFMTILSSNYINNEDEFGNNRGITSLDTLDLLELNGFKHTLTFKRENLNKKQYANEGKSLRFSVEFNQIDETYTPGTTAIESQREVSHEWFAIRGKWEQYFHKGKWSTGYLFEGAYSSQDQFANFTGTIINLPSFNPLQDSRTLLLQNFRAFSFGAFGIKNILSVRDNLDFRLEGYLFKPFETAQLNDGLLGRSADIDQIYLAASSSLVLHSPLGPISLSVNYYDDDENQWGALLHVGYLLFNKPSLGY